MSDETSPITELAHDRDGEGELLPVTETAEVHGSEFEIEVYPATTGQQNEWRNRLEDEGKDLRDEFTYELLEEFCAHDPEDFNQAEEWADVRPAITDAIGSVILARIFDAEDTGEFVEALEEAAAEATQGNEQQPAATD